MDNNKIIVSAEQQWSVSVFEYQWSLERVIICTNLTFLIFQNCVWGNCEIGKIIVLISLEYTGGGGG